MTEPSTQIDDEQRHVAELVRSFDAPAPRSLHLRVESLVATRQDRLLARRAARLRPFSSPVGLVSASAVAIGLAIAIAVGFSGGSPTLTLGQAAAPTLRAATLPAPAENRTHRTQLSASVDGVTFPYWGERLGWHSAGARSDQIDGRPVTTVFYTNASGRRIGYAILGGAPAPRIGGGVITWRGGVPYRLLTENGVPAVVWLRNGRLCVVSGRGVAGATLLRLASWSNHAATAS